MNTVSAPITSIQVGDIITTGFGTLNIESHTVTEITESYQYGYQVTVRCEDGYRITDSPNGFWYQVTKADPEAQARAAAVAEAFATAWDHRR